MEGVGKGGFRDSATKDCRRRTFRGAASQLVITHDLAHSRLNRRRIAGAIANGIDERIPFLSFDEFLVPEVLTSLTSCRGTGQTLDPVLDALGDSRLVFLPFG